jgi:hypothetical protein
MHLRKEQKKNIFVPSPISYQSAFAGKPNVPTRPHILPRYTKNSLPHICSFVFYTSLSLSVLTPELSLSLSLSIYIYIYDSTDILYFLRVKSATLLQNSYLWLGPIKLTISNFRIFHSAYSHEQPFTVVSKILTNKEWSTRNFHV